MLIDGTRISNGDHAGKAGSWGLAFGTAGPGHGLMHRKKPDRVSPARTPCTRSPVMSIHVFRFFDGVEERSVRLHGADPVLSGASGTSGFLPL